MWRKRPGQPHREPVWVVWDGPGGHVFAVCDSRRSVTAVRKFHHGIKLTVMRLDPMRYELNDGTLHGATKEKQP